MAGLKKSSKKDASNPNTVLVIALVMFVLTSIGLGVFAYFGYDGQTALRDNERKAKNELKNYKDQLNNFALLGLEAMLAEGYDLSPEQKSIYLSAKNELIAAPDKFNEVKKPTLDALFTEHAANLKGYNANEAKYESSYKIEIKRALDDSKKSRAMFEALQKEYNDYKGNYEALLARYEKDVADIRDRIQKGNQDILAASLKTSSKFPEIEKALAQSREDIEKRDKEHIDDIAKHDGEIARLNRKLDEAEKRLNDRALGLAAGPQAGGGGDVHALMLDISRGLPLWDRPLGRIFRVDPSNMLVYIDMGSKAGVKPDVTFNVFASGPGGKADRQLKGTIEVVRVVNETTSTCRITSLYDDKGESIPLQGESLRARALQAADDILHEGDLLFNTFFDIHVFIAGNVNFTGYLADSPAAQNLQLQEFMTQMRKQGVAVDGYINLLNGQVEGTITPKTRLLIRGEFVPINRTEDETNRYKQIVEAYQTMKKKAIDQGMFIISAENFAAVTGYRPPLAQNGRDLAATFRPMLPWTGGPQIQRFNRAEEGGIGTGTPLPEQKKTAVD